MTRINLGIPPADLCDQHLIAEYRELPRLFSFSAKSKPPKSFRLGSGHVLWCAQYQHTMRTRQHSIVKEMHYREFKTSFTLPHIEGHKAPQSEIARAVPIIRERINDRLSTMKRKTWTKREIPNWVNCNDLQENCNDLQEK